jgi:hypothetical protein
MVALCAILDAGHLIVDIVFKQGRRSHRLFKNRIVDDHHILLGEALRSRKQQGQHSDDTIDA